MTIDEAISHALKEVEQEECIINYPHSDIVLGDLDIESRKHFVAEQKQIAEWLTELKELREENKVLTSECDRLIKEKGELLSKVSGGDVLRICQLEEQLKDWKEEYANLNKISYGFYKELKEAKLLLKAAVEDLNATATEVYNGGVICKCCKWEFQIGECNCPNDGGCDTDYQWRYADEALKLIGED